MGFKTRKSVKLPGGVRVNLSKKGVGVSVGVRGARLSTGPSGTKLHTSIPGTGIRRTMSLGGRSRASTTSTTETSTDNTSCASATGYGCLALVGLVIVVKVASLLWAAMFTLWFWLILASIGLIYAAMRVYRLYARQRLEKRFFDALIVLSAPDADAEPILSELAVAMPTEADVSLLLAAQSASAGEAGATLAAIDMALAHADTLGNLSGGLTLHFPGIVAPLSFSMSEGGANALYLVRNHLFVQLGRAHEVSELPPMAPGTNPTMRALQLVTAADAHAALGNIKGALGNLEEALSIGAPTTLESAFRYKYARILEKAGQRDRAIAQYTQVVSTGGYDDADARLNELIEAHDNELFASVLQRLNKVRTIEEIRAILDNTLPSITNSAIQERLRLDASKFEADLLAHKRVEQNAFEENLVRESIARLERAEEPALRETIRQGTIAKLTDIGRKEHFLKEAANIEELARAANLKAAEDREERAITRALQEMDMALTPNALLATRDMARRLITSPSRRASFETAADKKIHEVQTRWKAEAEALENAAFDRTVAKMEVARGAAGRRSALEAGLREITNSQKRSELMAEASRIEVEAVLEKVDGLKTAAAKKRNLLAALEALRSDDVPDELQGKQIQWLEAALAELEGRAK